MGDTKEVLVQRGLGAVLSNMGSGNTGGSNTEEVKKMHPEGKETLTQRGLGAVLSNMGGGNSGCGNTNEEKKSPPKGKEALIQHGLGAVLSNMGGGNPEGGNTSEANKSPPQGKELLVQRGVGAVLSNLGSGHSLGGKIGEVSKTLPEGKEVLVQRGIGAILSSMGGGNTGDVKKPLPKVNVPKPTPTPPEEQGFDVNSTIEFSGWGDLNPGSAANTEGGKKKNADEQQKDKIEKKGKKDSVAREEGQQQAAPVHRGVGALLSNLNVKNLDGGKWKQHQQQQQQQQSFQVNRHNRQLQKKGPDMNSRPNISPWANDFKGPDSNPFSRGPGGRMFSGGMGTKMYSGPTGGKVFPGVVGSRMYYEATGANSEPVKLYPVTNQRRKNNTREDVDMSKGQKRKKFGFQETSLMGEYPGPRKVANKPWNTQSPREGITNRAGFKHDAPEGLDCDIKKHKQEQDYNFKEMNNWSDTLEYNDDEDSVYRAAENRRLAEEYGGSFITVKMLKDQGGKLGYYCELCFVEMNAKKTLDLHCGGMKHLKKKNQWEKTKGKTAISSQDAMGIPGSQDDTPDGDKIRPLPGRLLPPAAFRVDSNKGPQDCNWSGRQERDYQGRQGCNFMGSQEREYPRNQENNCSRRQESDFSAYQDRGFMGHQERDFVGHQDCGLPRQQGNPMGQQNHDFPGKEEPNYPGYEENINHYERKGYGRRDETPKRSEPPGNAQDGDLHFSSTSSALIPSRQYLSGETAGPLLKILSESAVINEDDADVATDVVSMLLESLKEFHEENRTPSTVHLISEVGLKFNIVVELEKAAQIGRAQSNKHRPLSKSSIGNNTNVGPTQNEPVKKANLVKDIKPSESDSTQESPGNSSSKNYLKQSSPAPNYSSEIAKSYSSAPPSYTSATPSYTSAPPNYTTAPPSYSSASQDYGSTGGYSSTGGYNSTGGYSSAGSYSSVGSYSSTGGYSSASQDYSTGAQGYSVAPPNFNSAMHTFNPAAGFFNYPPGGGQSLFTAPPPPPPPPPPPTTSSTTSSSSSGTSSYGYKQ